MNTSNTLLCERFIQPHPLNSQITGLEVASPATTGKNSSSGMSARKALLTIALAVLGTSSSYAQVDEKRHFISLMGGLSAPLGDYGATTGSNAGYAQLGSNFALESAFMFTKNIGIGASFGSFSNSLDADALLSSINRDVAAEGFSGNSSLEISRSFGNTYIMVGPNISIPLNKSTIDFRVGVGSVSTSLPATVYKISNEDYSFKLDQKEADGSAFGYSLGIGVRFNLSPKWALRVAGDYITAEPEIQSSGTVTFIDQDGSNSQSSSSKDKFPVSAYNFSIGIAYQFVK